MYLSVLYKIQDDKLLACTHVLSSKSRCTVLYKQLQLITRPIINKKMLVIIGKQPSVLKLSPSLGDIFLTQSLLLHPLFWCIAYILYILGMSVTSDEPPADGNNLTPPSEATATTSSSRHSNGSARTVPAATTISEISYYYVKNNIKNNYY